MTVSVVIIARSDLLVSSWQEAWPEALRLAPEAPPVAAGLAVILAGDPGWLSHVQHYSSLQIPVMVCSREANLAELRQAMQAGAKGYLDLFSPADILIRAAATLQQGALWVPPTLLNNLMATLSAALPEPAHDPFAELTVREQQVARAVVKGLSNKVVANELSISERTVKLHLTSIFSKLGIQDRMQLLLLSRSPR